jgi:arylsulfatase A-like enzyme
MKKFSMNTGRRRFLKLSAGGSALLGLSPLLGKMAVSAELPLQPNIVLIITDEERHWSMTETLIPSGLLSTYQNLIPGRMQLRNQGVRFNNYFTPTAPCSPARSVIFTGHHAVDNGVVDNMDFDTQQSLKTQVPTMADVLAEAGYYCAYKGKVHLTKDDVFEGEQGAANMLAMYGFHDWQGPSRLGDSEGPLSGMLRDDDVATYAKDWLASTGVAKSQANIPFLLAVNFINPHDIMMVDVDGKDGTFQLPQGSLTGSAEFFPLSPIPQTKSYLYWWNPQKPANADGMNGYSTTSSGPRPQTLDEWASMLSAVFGNISINDTDTTTIKVYRDNARPGLGTKHITVPLWQVYLNYYLNCIIDNDRAVLKVINAIKNNNLANDTLVILTADHGELALSHMGESRYYEAAATSEAEPSEIALQQPKVVMPLRQKGNFAYQENNCLPFVVARLGNSKGSLAKQLLPTINTDVPTLASSVDLLPTLVYWAGKDHTWYSENFGNTLSKLRMLNHLPGVSLHNVLATPAKYTSAQWSDGEQGRNWVLFTADTIASSLDADVVYKSVWGEDTGCGVDLTKIGCLRGLFDGTHKYARYFSPLDYALNGPNFADYGYNKLTRLRNGQDIQLFMHDTTSGALETYNSAADPGAPVQSLNGLLYQAMSKELARVSVPPDTVRNIIREARICEAG